VVFVRGQRWGDWKLGECATAVRVGASCTIYLKVTSPSKRQLWCVGVSDTTNKSTNKMHQKQRVAEIYVAGRKM